MKKILAILAMLFSSLVMVTVVAPPANAVTCGNWGWRYNAGDQVQFTNHGYTSSYEWVGGVKWRHCTNGPSQEYFEVERTRVDWDKTTLGGPYATCGGALYLWRIDQNLLGNWNPGTKITYCDGNTTSYTETWFAGSTPEKIWPSMGSAERCVAWNVEYDYNSVSGWQSDYADLDNICFDF